MRTEIFRAVGASVFIPGLKATIRTVIFQQPANTGGADASVCLGPQANPLALPPAQVFSGSVVTNMVAGCTLPDTTLQGGVDVEMEVAVKILPTTALSVNNGGSTTIIVEVS